MIDYRRILELHVEGISRRTISFSTGQSRRTISDVVKYTKNLGVEDLTDIKTNQWPEAFLHQEKQAIENGFFQVYWEGSTLEVIDCLTDEEIPSYVIIVALSYNQFSYVGTFLDLNSAS